MNASGISCVRSKCMGESSSSSRSAKSKHAAAEHNQDETIYDYDGKNQKLLPIKLLKSVYIYNNKSNLS